MTTSKGAEVARLIYSTQPTSAVEGQTIATPLASWLCKSHYDHNQYWKLPTQYIDYVGRSLPFSSGIKPERIIIE